MPRASIRRGTHQEIHIGQLRTDRYGVLSGSSQRHRDEDFDNPDYKYLLPSMAPPLGVPCVGVTRDYIDVQCRAIYTYTHEGVVDPVSFEGRIWCSLEGTDNEEPIETHPKFADLFKKYKGHYQPGTKRFDYFDPTLSGGVTKDGVQKNPLYGVTHFLAVGLIWTHTQVMRELPSNLLARVDCIDKPIGFGAMQPPSLSGRRNWLQLAPNAAQRGNVIQVTKRWLASGRNGWNEDVYNERTAAGA